VQWVRARARPKNKKARNGAALSGGGVQSRAGANSQPQRPVNISDVVRGVITRLPFSLLYSEFAFILTLPAWILHLRWRLPEVEWFLHHTVALQTCAIVLAKPPDAWRFAKM
jgi:hypothetical protein